MEKLLLKKSRSLLSRLRLGFYQSLGLCAGRGNRIERIRCRRLRQIQLGNGNAFSEGCWLWPNDDDAPGFRIVIGDGNYFNRDVMLDACRQIVVGDGNMFGPGVYITDSNHGVGIGREPSKMPMQSGRVRIGNHCWIGAKAVLLKDVELGDFCVVAAGAVVTKSFPAGSLVAGVPATLVRVLENA